MLLPTIYWHFPEQISLESPKKSKESNSNNELNMTETNCNELMATQHKRQQKIKYKLL